MPRLIFGSWIRFFGLVFFLSLLNGCVNNDDLPEPDVYVAGSIGKWDNSIPCLWKNGVRTNLDVEEGEATAVFVSGGNVYVAGFRGDANLEGGTPGYWVNGAWQEFMKNPNDGRSVTSAILVVAGDVYVSGYHIPQGGRKTIPCYWKNGVRTDLDMGDFWNVGNGKDIFISGGDLFVAGDVTFSGCFAPCAVACYWKNGVRTELDKSNSNASGISVSAGDVIVSGMFNSLPCYWRNGERNDLGIPDGFRFGRAQAISVFAGRIHVAGSTSQTSDSFPCVWSDGARCELNVIDASLGGWAYSLQVDGDDVYVAGSSKTSTGTAPCYWKNGDRTDLDLAGDTAGGGWAYDIFVTRE